MVFSKLISIDTSVFGGIAKDYFSNNEKASSKAINAVEHLIEKGFIPFITHHHIQEILQHQDDDVVFRRWSLIKAFPRVAWMCSYWDENILGSIVDLHLLEIKLILDSGETGPDNLVKEVKDEYVKYSTGEEFVENFEQVYSQIRALGLMTNQKSKKVESLNYVTSKKVEKVKLSTLFDSSLRHPASVKEFLAGFEVQLTDSLVNNGDDKLVNPQHIAKEFVKEVSAGSEGMYADDSSLYERFVKNAGVRLDQVSPKTTVGQLARLSTYNKKIQGFLKSLDVPQEREFELSFEKQVIFCIWEHFDKAMKHEKKAHGSNMQDKHMGVFALLVDIFTVDKRVHEYFRQFSKRNTDFAGHLGKIVKLSDYSSLVFLK